MPHIKLHAFDSRRNIQRMDIHVEVEFSREYYHSGKATEKLKEIQQALDNVAEIYFDDFESGRWLHNHNYNRGEEYDG